MQGKIDKLRGNATIKLADLAPSIGSWLDTQDLAIEGLTQEFMKEHILEDLISYEGVEE